jgi:hypothetical protein
MSPTVVMLTTEADAVDPALAAAADDGWRSCEKEPIEALVGLAGDRCGCSVAAAGAAGRRPTISAVTTTTAPTSTAKLTIVTRRRCTPM